MPASSKVDKVVGGGIVEKLRARKTAQICKKRPTKVDAKGQLQRSRGVIVTMSVEQSGGISLKTPEGVATSHSRKISTTSALFSPMGVSIGVVCESTTENKEVIVDMKNCLKDNAKIVTDQINLVPEIKIPLKTNSKPLIFQFRKDLSFLREQQIEKLSEFNVKSIQQLLNIPFGKLLELKLSNKQLQLLIALVKNEMRGIKIPKEAHPLKAIAEELDKLDANDDDDEKPLVIDESFPTIYENKNVSNIKEERSLEAIEECFTHIRSVKVPQSRAALKEVRSELTEIISELNVKENRILDNIHNKKDTVKTAITEEDVTTTTTPTNPNLQPTVMIRKLPTPLRKQKFKVDADSTTNLDLTFSNESEVKTVADVADAKKPRSAPVQKKAKKRNMKVMNLMEGKSNADQEKFDISENADVHIPELSDVKKECVAERQSKVLEDRFELMSKIPSVESPLLTSKKIEIVKFEDSGVVLDESIKFNNQKVCDQDKQSEVPVLTNDLDTCANDLGSNVSVSSQCEDKFEIPIISAKRRIEFDAKKNDESGKFSTYDTCTAVKISNTPLSPISNDIMSPINPNFFTNDYKPALEINGHCTGILYLVKEIDVSNISINKPDNLDMLLRSNTADPRLLKFLKKENSALHSSATFCGINKVVQSDPRRSSSVYNAETFLKQHNQDLSQPTANMLLYGCLQRSPWYQSLMSTMKIQINQSISILVRAINNFQKIRLSDPYAVFDIFKIYCAGELLEILENLGLFVDVNGVIYEKKNMSSYGGRSYGCASVVNATYSFIQPVEPQSVTVQQQMRSFTSPATNFSATPTTFQPSASFISCYIDSPRETTNKSPQMPQPYLRRSKPSPYRAPLPSVPPRRHCGLKVPYASNAAPTRSSLSPVKRQPRCSDSEEENWDLDENIKSSTPLKPPLSPCSANDYEHSSSKYANGNQKKSW